MEGGFLFDVGTGFTLSAKKTPDSLKAVPTSLIPKNRRACRHALLLLPLLLEWGAFFLLFVGTGPTKGRLRLPVRTKKQGARHGGTAFVTDLAMGYFQNIPFLLGLRLRLTGFHTIAYIEI